MTQQKTLSITAHDVPSEIQQLATEARLGKLRKVYSTSKGNIKIAGIGLLMTGGLIIGITALVLILVTVFGGPASMPGDVFSRIFIGLFFSLLGLLCLLPGCYMAFSRGIYPYWHVYLWERGFVYEKGKVHQVFRWEQIESIKGQTGYTEGGIGYVYKVHHQNSSEVKLDNAFPEIAELIDILLEESARQLAPQEIKIAHNRDTVVFTDFGLDQQGIGNQQETVPWEEVQNITLKNGTAIIQKKGK